MVAGPDLCRSPKVVNLSCRHRPAEPTPVRHTDLSASDEDGRVPLTQTATEEERPDYASRYQQVHKQLTSASQRLTDRASNHEDDSGDSA